MFDFHEKQKEVLQDTIKTLPFFRLIFKALAFLTICAGLALEIYIWTRHPINIFQALGVLFLTAFGVLMIRAFFKAAEKFILSKAEKCEIIIKEKEFQDK